MQFLSVHFVLFLLFAISGYLCCGAKYRYLFILGCNILFYFSWINRIEDVFPLALIICFTWAGSLLTEKSRVFGIGSIIVCVAALFYFKYIHFIGLNIDLLSKKMGFKGLIPPNPIAPIGISFFTFQAVGYVIDVLSGKTKPEKNILRYVAFVSFFPTITSGPIERSDFLLKSLREDTLHVSYDDLCHGVILFIFGAFVKLVISDRLAVAVNTVFDNYYAYGGAVLFLASLGYTLQIYCDFSSYSLLAMGVARCFGLKIVENFKAPYFAESVQEFWRRWHISLSTWFRDYVYISLGGNRCSTIRKNLNLLITFLVSGIWHGANWTFLFWGLLHGLYQVMGNQTKKVRKNLIVKMKIDTDCFSFHFIRKVSVFLLVSFAWIFFRSSSLKDAFLYIYRMVHDPRLWQLVDGTLYNLGLAKLQLDILFFALVLFFFLDIQKYKTDKNPDVLLLEQNTLFRCAALAALAAVTVVFGLYGPGFNAKDFIYFRF